MRRAALALALAAAASGCAPALLWYGHDPGRATRWELRQKDGRTWLEAGPGRRSGDYDEIAVAHLTFAPDGARFAVPARRGAKWSMLVDLAPEGPAWDGVADALFSADGRHLAYAGERDGRWSVVLDGAAGPAVEAIVEGTMAFGPNGRRLAYAATDGPCVRVVSPGEPPAGCYRGVRALFVGDRAAQDRVVARVVIDGREGPALVDVAGVLPTAGLSAWAFDARDGRLAAVLRDGPRARLAVDGTSLDEADEIAQVAFSPAGQVARAVRDDGGWRFSLDGHRDGAWRWIRPAVFSRTGRRYAYVAGAPDGRAAVVIDGRARGLWTAASGLTFSDDERRVAYAVRAGAQMGISCDDRVYPFDVVIESSVGFSADSRHWAALVGDRGRRRLSIVVDGQRHLAFDSEELFGAAAAGAADLRGLRAWVVAELERDLRGGAR